MPQLLLDPETHTYTLDGKKIMGVTEVLESAGIKPKSEYRNGAIDHALLLGNYVHQATALDDRGVLDDTSLDEQLLPYLTAWRKWKSEYQPRFYSIEESIATDGCAGTPDRVAVVDDRRGVIELKTGNAEKWHRIQAEFYRQMVEVDDRHLVYLHEDGTYTYELWLPDVRHAEVRNAALVVATWKRTREK